MRQSMLQPDLNHHEPSFGWSVSMILLAKGLTLFVEQPPLIETLVSVFGLCAIILTIINNVGPAIDKITNAYSRLKGWVKNKFKKNGKSNISK